MATRRDFTSGATAALAAGLLPAAARAEATELRLSRQPSIVYLPMVLIEAERLIEKQAEKAGLGPIKTTWMTFASGGAGTDALLAGKVDIVSSGVSNQLILWDRTKGEVKGLASVSAVPMVLVTRNPKVKTLADFTAADRIAVPTVKVSMQATVLQMAAAKLWGDAELGKLDSITVQLGHPDAAAALSNPSSEINSHFSLPPFLNRELQDKNVHAVLQSNDVVGGPVSNGVAYATKKFVDSNPKLVAVFMAALDEAMTMIRTDPQRTAEIYLALTKDNFSPEALTKEITGPGVVYATAPQNTMKIADHMAKSGVVKTKPASWKDYFFATVHDQPGA